MLVPEELRARRLALGFTQTRLAEALGVAPNTIARWERGERAVRNVSLVLEAFDRLALSQRAQHNLPATLTTFVGREREVYELAGLVRSQRIVTLTGAGGCGKSRLALEVAANVIGSFTDGVWLVEMAALNDGALVASSAVAALDIAAPAHRPLLDTLAAALRGKHLLLILDNCEHLLPAASEVIDRVARSCPHVHVLGTSREPLRIDGEVRYRVPALSPGDAVRLFVERARAVKHTFALDAASEPVVTRVCQRLDGMPLAIEFAAARASVLSPVEIEARLDHRLAFLTGGSRVAQPRQRTLRATLDWSHALLGKDQRALLRRLSVFSGSWSRAAMDALCAEDGVDLLDALEHLVNAALVSADEAAPQTRYRLLESVREYAAEQLRAANEDTMLRDRHLAWYAALAEQAEPELRGPEQSAWFARLELELDNLRAALELAATASDVDAAVRLGAALWEFWELRGRAREGLALMRPLLDRSVDDTPRARAKLLWAVGSVALACGENDLAESLLEQSLQLARALDNPWHAGRALVRLGQLAFYRGDIDLAAALFEENLAIRRALDHQRGIAVSVHNLAEVALRRGDLETATRLFEDSLRMGREQHDTQLIAGTLVRLGDIAGLEHDLPRASTLLRESVRLNREIGATAQFPDCLEGLARVAFDAGDPERATRLLAASEAVREELGVPIPPIDWPAHQRLQTELHRTLGGTAFDATWAAGRAQPLENALHEALATHSPRIRHGPLSPRERDVARQIARGLTNREIANHLIVSERTVDAHCRSIYDKLGVGSRAQVAAWAVATGLARAE